MGFLPFTIPGNIKQQYLPFLLNPESPLNDSSNTITSSIQLKNNCDPQFFTFRTQLPYMQSGSAKLNICPTSFQKFFNKDISNQLLYSKNVQTKAPVTIEDIYNSSPAISIREFLPDARLDQAINLFGDLVSKVIEMLNGSKTTQSTSTDSESKDKGNFLKNLIDTDFKSMGKNILNIIQHAFHYLTGSTTPTNLFTDENGRSRFTGYSQQMGNLNGLTDTYVLSFPWMLYYRLQSSVTSNIYELPCNLNKKVIFNSNGSNGWETTGMDIDGVTGGNSAAGGGGDFKKMAMKFLGAFTGLGDVFKNIRVNFMPYWDSKSGTDTPYTKLEITFDLFNDTEEAAMKNFIFVNTIAPSNKWIQYNVFQHSSPLYDVKLEGLYRMYACTGNFSVEYKGILRDPPDIWIEKLIKKHGNLKIKKSKDFILANKLIKIPDIYTVNMSFASVLPDNFNNYIYSYTQNINHIDTYYTNVYDESQYAKIIVEPMAGFWNEMKDYIKSDKYKNDENIKKAFN